MRVTKLLISAAAGFGLFTTAQAATLGASDVAILWSVKPGNELDTVYKMRGNGRCNLPTLGLKTTNDSNSSVAAVSNAQFENFARITYGRGSKGLCNEVIPEGMPTGSALKVMKTNGQSHLSLVHGLTNTGCKYEKWNIVGVRFNPCSNFDVAKNKVIDKASLESSCNAQVRLVAQPFNDGDNNFFPEDQSLHLIYTVSNRDEVVKDLARIAKITRANSKQWDEFDNKPDVFRPHAGLRSEMDNCLPGGKQGPVAREVLSFLRKHTTSDKLANIAWMTTTTTNMEWSFGMAGVSGSNVTRMTMLPGEYDNFSEELFDFDSQFPFNANQDPAVNPGIEKVSIGAMFGKNAMMKETPNADDKAKMTEMLKQNDKFLNPEHTNELGATCFSCHMNEQAANEMRERKGVSIQTSEFRYNLGERWPSFGANKRSMYNFRNFGIGPNFQPGISLRSLNDFDHAMKLVNKHYATAVQSGLN